MGSLQLSMYILLLGKHDKLSKTAGLMMLFYVFMFYVSGSYSSLIKEEVFHPNLLEIMYNQSIDGFTKLSLILLHVTLYIGIHSLNVLLGTLYYTG